MKVKQVKKDGDVVVLEATASPQDVARVLQFAQEGFANSMGLMPEPGKTVAQAVEEKMGIKNLDQVVANEAASALVPMILDKRNIIPAFLPKVEAQTPLERGKECKITLTVTLRPEFELTSYDPVTVEVEEFSVDEAAIQAELDTMRSQYTSYVADPDADPERPIAAGDFVKIAIDATGDDGKPFRGLSTSGRTYAVGAGHMPEGFDSQIQGMKVGEKKEFSFEAPSFDDNFNETSEKVDTKVEVLELLKEQAPELDDAWVEKNMPWAQNAEGLKASIRKSLEVGQRDSYDAYLRQAVASAWAERFDGHIADEMYEGMMAQLRDNIRAELQQQGKNWDQFVEESGGESNITMMLMMQARDVLTQGYALDAIFRHFGLTATDEDYDAVCRAMNPQANPRQLRELIQHRGQGFALRESAERYKANKFAVENANIEYIKAD